MPLGLLGITRSGDRVEENYNCNGNGINSMEFIGITTFSFPLCMIPEHDSDFPNIKYSIRTTGYYEKWRSCSENNIITIEKK